MCFCRDHNSTLIDAYLAALKRRRYSAKTVQTYGNALGHFTSFLAAEGVEELQDVSAATVEAWRLRLVDRGLAPASLEVFLRAVRLLFNWMEESGQLFLNPCCDLVVPKHPRKLLPVPTEEQIGRLLARPNTASPLGLRDRALLETAYATAARRDELVRMTIFDPDLTSKTVRIQGKGSKERVVPLGRHGAQWIERYLNTARPRLAGNAIACRTKPWRSLDQEALWIGWHAVPMTGNAMNVQLKRHAASAGVEMSVSLHSLRRACATHMLQHGAHPVQIQMLLGHATLKHLSQYLRLTITEIKAMHEKSKPGK